MTIKSYAKFRLLLESTRTPNHYRACLLDSDEGEAEEEFVLPFLSAEQNFLKPEQWLYRNLRSYQPENITTTPIPTKFTPEEIGKRLFDAVFKGKIYHLLVASLTSARNSGKGLRLILCLGPELAQLPWEYLYSTSSNGFFALSVETPIVRYLTALQPTTPRPVTDPLCILAVISNPSDYRPLNGETEWNKLQNALEGSQSNRLITLEKLPQPTWDALQERLAEQDKPVHILHFIGHGGFNEKNNKGELLFEDTAKNSYLVDADKFSDLLRDHKSLRLLFLNSCESGRNASLLDYWGGVAQTVIQRTAIGAVVAMQYEVADEAAIKLADIFYQSIVSGYPVDAALAQARKNVYGSQFERDWGTPVLFMRAPDGILFEVTDEARYPGFLTPQLDMYDGAKKLDPQVYDDLHNRIQSKRLLILNDHAKLDKKSLARYVAQGIKTAHTHLPIWEWEDTSGRLDFEDKFDEAETPKSIRTAGVFIFPNMSRQTIDNKGLAQYQPRLEQRNQYIILTTMITKEQWILNETEKSFWFDLPEISNIYNVKYLTDELKQDLANAREHLPKGFSFSDILTTDLDEETTLQKLAKELGSPENIAFFVGRLYTSGINLDQTTLQKLIKEASEVKYEEQINYWYRQLSEPSDKLWSVALCLFGDLFESQFFLLLGEVAKEPWKHPFGSIGILDHFHLDKLRNLIIYIDTRTISGQVGEKKIEHRYPDQRQVLLKQAWDSHRKHVRAALPVIAEVIRKSVAPWASRREEFSDEDKRRHLRNILGEVLSAIGRFYFYSVEEILLTFAYDSNQGVQSVAALAIAAWYTKENNPPAQLPDVLQRWQDIARRRTETSSKNLQLTIAQTLYHITLNYPTSHLPEPLLDLLWELPCNRYSNVRNVFDKSIRYNLLGFIDQIIERWHILWQESPGNQSDVKWVPALLSIADLCRGRNFKQFEAICPWLVKVLEQTTTQNPKKVIEWLSKLRHFVPEVFVQCCSQADHFKQLRPTLLCMAQCSELLNEVVDLFVKINKSHRDAVANTLEDWHSQWLECLNKRQEEQTKQWYPALLVVGMIYDQLDQFMDFSPWLESFVIQESFLGQSEPPHTQLTILPKHFQLVYILSYLHQEQIYQNKPGATATERLLYTWLENRSADPTIHQFVLLLFSRWTEWSRNKSYPTLRSNFFAYHIDNAVIWFLNPLTWDCHTTVHNLLPLAMSIHKHDPQWMDEILEVWRSNENSKITKDIAILLRRAIRVLSFFSLSLPKVLKPLIRLPVSGILPIILLVISGFVCAGLFGNFLLAVFNDYIR